ncbi:MAG TPA: hypothetical protein VGN64_06725 [Dyadobacter sp.]|jgi:hypothetical protein|nr:hypothetical protein [Dyadobacter sp.]
MKRFLLLFVIAFSFVGCSKDEIDPDLTKNFIGSWQSEWTSVATNMKGQYTWNVTKETNTTLKITSYYEMKIGDIIDGGTDVATGIKVVNENTFTLDDPATEQNGYVKSEGNGVVSGDILTVLVKGTDIKTGQVSSENIVLKRK